MKMVVLNAGSGSQKCSLFELPVGPLSDEPHDPIWEAKLDSTAPDQPKGKLVIRISRHGEDIEAGCMDEEATTAERTQRLLRMLWEEPAKIVSQAKEVDVIGHRVVHGGAEFREAVRVTADVEAAIERCVYFAPLHNPSNLTGIRVARQLFGENKPQFAIFDTAFHRTLSDAAASYAGPRGWIDQGIRRYGFHGTSFRYASGRAGQLLGRIDDPKLRLILCHLGGGCSLCATGRWAQRRHDDGLHSTRRYRDVHTFRRRGSRYPAIFAAARCEHR
jgi:acetate kinase